jgi:hypothetical protein
MHRLDHHLKVAGAEEVGCLGGGFYFINNSCDVVSDGKCISFAPVGSCQRSDRRAIDASVEKNTDRHIREALPPYRLLEQ